uniref:ORF132 n=1 Tax=Angiostrongylus cantonensis TaxID=6313 RepID=A0A0K0DGU1_ANGCA
MPILFLPGSYDVTHDDIERFVRLKAIIKGQWSPEQVETYELDVLLVVIVLVMVAITAVACYKMNCCGRNSRRESTKVTPPQISTPPYYISPPPAVVVKYDS